MKRSTKVIIFIGIPVMAMLGNWEASIMYNNSWWKVSPLSDFEMKLNALVVGAITFVAAIMVVGLQYMLQHFFRYVLKNARKNK